MPHYTNYGGTFLSAQPQIDSFGSFEPRQEKLQKVPSNGGLIGLKGGQEGEEFSMELVTDRNGTGSSNVSISVGGDSLTGMDRPVNIWTTVSPSTLEDKANCANSYVDEDVDGFLKLSDTKGESERTDLGSENRFLIERFEPDSVINNIGASFNPVMEQQTNWDLVCNLGTAVSQAEVIPKVAMI